MQKGVYTKRTVIVCDWCGKEFLIRNCYLRRPQKHHTCSHSCSCSLRNASSDDILGTQIRTGVKPKYQYNWSIDSFGYKRFNRGIYKNKRVHVVVIERLIGRPLYKNEQVHHIDEDKLNNNKENLLLVTISEHRKIHHKLKAEAKARMEVGQ